MVYWIKWMIKCEKFDYIYINFINKYLSLTFILNWSVIDGPGLLLWTMVYKYRPLFRSSISDTGLKLQTTWSENLQDPILKSCPYWFFFSFADKDLNICKIVSDEQL